MFECEAGQALRAGLDELGLPASQQQVAALLEYLALLETWNSSFNLTSVREPVQMVYRHLLDSLAITRFIPDDTRRLADVGSGGGLPGIPLAIMMPRCQFDLLDSNGKKTRFLFQVKTALSLDNMAAHQVRAQAWEPSEPYDVVLSRAFASLSDMLDCCQHMCRPGGSLLAMKGQYPEAEIAELKTQGKDIHIAAIHQIRVPGLLEDRHLVELSRSGGSSTAGEAGCASG